MAHNWRVQPFRLQEPEMYIQFTLNKSCAWEGNHPLSSTNINILISNTFIFYSIDNQTTGANIVYKPLGVSWLFEDSATHQVWCNLNGNRFETPPLPVILKQHTIMKQTTIIFGLILIINQSLKSQDYVPFPKEKVNWNVFYVGTCQDAPPDTVLIRYTIHGDTTINEIQYSKLCIESGDATNPKIHGIGGLRESDKKVYYRGQTIIGGGNDKEYLLYDFTKQIGDTIKHDSYGGFISVVLDIDSVLIGENYRKRFKVDNHWFYQNPDYIIEGIGSVKNGLLGHISNIPTCGSHYWEHICFRQNSIVKYLNPTFSECFPSNLLTGVGQLDYETGFDIYPNPFKNEIQIDNKLNNRELIFKLIDINGKTLIAKNINGDKVSFNLDINSGIYNALIIDKNGKILISKKVIKE